MAKWTKQKKIIENEKIGVRILCIRMKYNDKRIRPNKNRKYRNSNEDMWLTLNWLWYEKSLLLMASKPFDIELEWRNQSIHSMQEMQKLTQTPTMMLMMGHNNTANENGDVYE